MSVLIGGVAGVLGIIAAHLAPRRCSTFLVNASGALIVYIYIDRGVANPAAQPSPSSASPSRQS